MDTIQKIDSPFLRCLISLTSFFLLFGGLAFNLEAAAPITSAVIRELTSRPKAEVVILIFLKEKADFSAAEHFSFKEEKTKYVHDRLLEVANRTQGELVSYLTEKNLFFKRFYITNAIAIYGPSLEQIKELAARPEVDKISLDPNVKMDRPFVKPPSTQKQALGRIEPTLKAIGVDRVWNELKVTGKGIVMASQDSGIRFDHPALARQYRGAHEDGSVDHDYNWYDAIARRTNVNTVNSCGYDSKIPCDDDDHGTHTLGTMLGDDGAGNQVGVAPDAKWVACRNMDAGDGRPSFYIDCFQFFMAPYPVGGDAFKDGEP